MKLAIAVPCRNPETDIVPETRETLTVFHKLGHTPTIRAACNHLEQNRSVITSELAAEHDAVLWWDSDVTARDPKAVIRMCERSYRENQVTCGLYPQRGGGRLAGVGIPKRIPEYQFPIEAGATGCMLIPSAVVELVSAHLPELTDNRGRKYHPLFKTLLVGPMWLGEDYSFCLRARDCGVSIMADPSVELGHVAPDGAVDWSTKWLS